ncbi:MAG: hypothetical protein KF770_09150 [Anaerolineae bacterium]|nr:hypothetical protein [Anaerolineae bacterium]
MNKNKREKMRFMISFKVRKDSSYSDLTGFLETCQVLRGCIVTKHPPHSRMGGLGSQETFSQLFGKKSGIETGKDKSADVGTAVTTPLAQRTLSRLYWCCATGGLFA